MLLSGNSHELAEHWILCNSVDHRLGYDDAMSGKEETFVRTGSVCYTGGGRCCVGGCSKEEGQWDDGLKASGGSGFGGR